ncbi:MAG TPA: TolC family protein [Terracidiphilus sp.]|jgi:outer membrane protein TolC|nr:TolC family protein [Terracidiphilus sp.]
MKTLLVAIFLLPLCNPPNLSRAQTPNPGDGPAGFDTAALDVASFDAVTADRTSSSPSIRDLTLDEAESIASAESPEIHVAVRRVAMAEAHVAAAGAFEDPQFMYRGWQVPLKHPWDYNSAQNMLMISEALPGPGKRGLESGIATTDVQAEKYSLESTRLRVHVEVRKAFYDLLLAQDELQIHDQHVAIAHQAIEAARIKYTTGKVPQQDMLKAQLALTRLAEHMVRFDRDADVARAHLNTLLGRNPTLPISLRGDFQVDQALPSAQDLEKLALQSRPDLLGAQIAANKSRQEQALAKKAYVPDFTLSAGYMLMPSGSDPRNNYMIEGSVSLPWLNHRKHDADISEAAAKVTDEDAELAALRNEAFGQIEEALADARAAQRLAAIYKNALRPQADATLHAAVIAYENNQTELLDLLDSQMTVIDIDLSWRQAMGDFSARMADLELAVGIPLEPQFTAAEEKK